MWLLMLSQRDDHYTRIRWWFYQARVWRQWDVRISTHGKHVLIGRLAAIFMKVIFKNNGKERNYCARKFRWGGKIRVLWSRQRKKIWRKRKISKENRTAVVLYWSMTRKLSKRRTCSSEELRRTETRKSLIWAIGKGLFVKYRYGIDETKD